MCRGLGICFQELLNTGDTLWVPKTPHPVVLLSQVVCILCNRWMNCRENKSSYPKCAVIWWKWHVPFRGGDGESTIEKKHGKCVGYSCHLHFLSFEAHAIMPVTLFCDLGTIMLYLHKAMFWNIRWVQFRWVQTQSLVVLKFQSGFIHKVLSGTEWYKYLYFNRKVQIFND